MRFEHFYFDSRVIGPLHEMLRDSEIELVRLAVPYCISFEERLQQLGAAKALAAATGSSTPSPDSIPIVCDLWLLDSKNQLYRATMRSDSRFSFLPLSTSSSQPLFLKTIFSTPNGRVMGIDLSGNLLQDYSPSTDLTTKVHNNLGCLNGSISYNTTPTGGNTSLIGMDATLSPLLGGSPTTFVDATFINNILVGIDPYGNVWRRLLNSLWTSSSCLTSSQDLSLRSSSSLLHSPPSSNSTTNLLASSGEFIWTKSVQDAKIHLASISGVWGLDKSGSLLKTNDGGNSWQFVDVPESSSGIPLGFSSSQQHTFSVQTPHFSRIAARNSSSLWLIERHSKRLMILNQKETKVPVSTSSTSDKSEALSFPSTTIPVKSDPTVSQTPVNYVNTLQIAPDSGMLQFVDICTGPDGYGLWTLKLASKIASAGAVSSVSVSSRATLSPQPPPRSGLSLSNGASRFQFSEVCKLVIQELQTTPIKRFIKIWDDRNTGAKENDLAIFRPLPPATIASFISVRRGKTKSLWRKGRWMSLGDFAERSHLDRPLTYNFDSPLNARRFLIRECVMLSEQDYVPPPTPFFVSRPGTGRRNSSRKEMEKSISTEFFVDEDETFGEEVLDVEPEEGKEEEEREEKEEELELHDYELDIYSVGGGNGDPYNLMLDIFPPPLLTVPENFQKVWDDSGTGGITAISKFGEVSIWKPIPPPGFVALGHVSSPDRVTKPSSVCVGCVHSSAVVPAPFYRYPSGFFNQQQGAGYLWCDRHSGGKIDGSLWMADGEEGLSVATLTFISAQGYHQPSHELFWAFPFSNRK